MNLLCFFFKQKTAYEMRISDWSSDVCSSDLGPRNKSGVTPGEYDAAMTLTPEEWTVVLLSLKVGAVAMAATLPVAFALAWVLARGRFPGKVLLDALVHLPLVLRSEEHTSELQSLMRISYAVFCLKKTIHKTHNIV